MLQGISQFNPTVAQALPLQRTVAANVGGYGSNIGVAGNTLGTGLQRTGADAFINSNPLGIPGGITGNPFNLNAGTSAVPAGQNFDIGSVLQMTLQLLLQTLQSRLGIGANTVGVAQQAPAAGVAGSAATPVGAAGCNCGGVCQGCGGTGVQKLTNPAVTAGPGMRAPGPNQLVNAADLANFPGMETASPRLRSAMSKIANTAANWKNNMANNPAANKSDPQYVAGQIAYNLVVSARQSGTRITSTQLPNNILGENINDGQMIRINQNVSEEQMINTLIHEFGHNQNINGVNLGADNSQMEEAVNKTLGDFVSSAITGGSPQSLQFYMNQVRGLYRGLKADQPGYLQNIQRALGINIA